MLGILIINAIFSIIFPIGKLAMVYAGPFFTVGIRMVVGGLMLLCYRFIAPDHRRDHTTRAFWWNIALLAIFNIFLTNVFEFWGLRYMSSAKTSFIYNLAPFFSALFGYFYFNEQMTLKKYAGLFISSLGFIPIFVMNSPRETLLSHFFFFSSAEISLLCATIALTLGWIIMQDVVRNKQFDAILVNGLSMVLGGTFAFIPSLIFHETIPLTHEWGSFMTLIVIMGVLSSCICYPLYTHLLKTYTATFMTFAGLLGPVMAAFFDWIFFGEMVRWEFFAATAIVCIGLYIFYQEELRQGYLVK